MKMKKMIYFLFALLIMSVNSMNAQVAIGTDPALEPRTGTILDLGQVTGKNLGLLLPQVELTDAKLWTPPVEGSAIDGMMVFNTNDITTNDLDGKGIYVWYNSRWNKISYSAVVPDLPLTQDNPNPVSICYGSTTKFTLAAASGGAGVITYNWQQSLTGANESWVDANGTHNEVDYTTPALTTNMFYRRTATASVSGGTIYSNSAEVTVYPNFTQPNPANANVCQGLTTTLTLAAATGGSGAITYNWQKSTNNSTWEDADGIRNTADYTTPTTLVASNTYYFRRKAIDAECEPIYSNSALVTVSQAFTQPNPAGATVCWEETKTITLAAASGGSGAISYNWQESPTGADGSWVDATGTRNGVDYTTPALTADMYYRRQATCTCGTIPSQSAKVEVTGSIGEVTSAASPYYTYATYSYPNHLGIWTENVKEGTPAKTTFGEGTADQKQEGERGYYYTWANAAAACTAIGTGWALPTDSQWQELKVYLNNTGSLTCDKRFMLSGRALAGFRSNIPNWHFWDLYGTWWSATVDARWAAYNSLLDGPVVSAGYNFSVRCVKSN